MEKSAKSNAPANGNQGKPVSLGEPVRTPIKERLVSIDAYRGAVMLLLAGGGFGLPAVAAKFPSNTYLNNFAAQFTHVEWTGCRLWDLIQPSFMFLVGVSMAFSYAARKNLGQSYGRMFGHAAVRAAVLILLGVFLRSINKTATNFTFEDVLSQIGLGYIFLFLLWNRSWWLQLIAAAAILVGYGAWFHYSPPTPDDYKLAEVAADWEPQKDLALAWHKNVNPAARFERWFLNLFPRENGVPFKNNGGGYLTLNFIPSLGTMIFGLMAGGWLRTSRNNSSKLAVLYACGILFLAAGWGLDYWRICPIVKIIWTPSWTLFSAGWALVFLATFYALFDAGKLRAWAYPLSLVGMNSIVIYCMPPLIKEWIMNSLKIHLGPNVFTLFGAFDAVYEPIVKSILIVFTMWLILAWMHRQRIFVRI